MRVCCLKGLGGDTGRLQHMEPVHKSPIRASPASNTEGPGERGAPAAELTIPNGGRPGGQAQKPG